MRNPRTLVLAPTLFEHAARKRCEIALLSSKAEDSTFLLGGAEIVLTAENPSPEWVQKIGLAPPSTAVDINYWLMRAAIDILKPSGYRCPVHPHDGLCYAHVAAGGGGIERTPGADRRPLRSSHACSSRCGIPAHRGPWNERQNPCAGISSKSAPVKESRSGKPPPPGRDRYMKHHRGCSGAAYVYLKIPQDAARVRDILFRSKRSRARFLRAKMQRKNSN